MKTDITDGDNMEFLIHTGGQDWVISWYAPSTVPPGTPHGSAGICITDRGEIVLISVDGTHWDLPAGRPEHGEDWEQTLRREVLEEACSVVITARLLGFGRSECVAGPEKGLALVRSHWCAQVTLGSWEPQFETAHRLLVPSADVLSYLPPVFLPITRRALQECGLLR